MASTAASGQIEKLIRIRERRTQSALKEVRRREDALKAAERVRAETKRNLDRISYLRDQELDQMRQRMFTHGVTGASVHIGMMYTRQLEIRWRASEVQFTRADGEMVKAKLLLERQRKLLTQARIKEEIAGRLSVEIKRVETKNAVRKTELRLDELAGMRFSWKRL
jgi:YscO-like protein